jgi:hypothetical protein
MHGRFRHRPPSFPLPHYLSSSRAPEGVPYVSHPTHSPDPFHRGPIRSLPYCPHPFPASVGPHGSHPPARGLLYLTGLIVLGALLALTSSPVFARPADLPALPQAQEAPPSELRSLEPMDQLSAYLDWIRQETRSYREALETDRQDFVDMAQFVAWLVVSLVTLAGVAVMYTTFRNSNEIRKMMELRAQALVRLDLVVSEVGDPLAELARGGRALQSPGP